MHHAFSPFAFDESARCRYASESHSKTDFSVAYLKKLNDIKHARQRYRHRQQEMNKGE